MGRDTYFTGNDERDGFDGRAMDLVSTCNLAIRDAEAAPGEEAHSTLRVRGFVFGEGEEGVGFVFIVSDVAVTFTSCGLLVNTVP